VCIGGDDVQVDRGLLFADLDRHSLGVVSARAAGMRSRKAPTARAIPTPTACTPSTSRVAMPAIFETTVSAIVVLPCECGVLLAWLLCGVSRGWTGSEGSSLDDEGCR